VSFNRRDFLKFVGLGAVAGCAVPTLQGETRDSAATGKWRMHLSTSSIHFIQLPIEQACERIAKLGFEAIDIWSAHEGCPHLDDITKRLGAEGLKELLARCKLKLAAFSVYSGGYARYAELLGKVGGGVAIQGSSQPCKPEELTSRMRQFIDDLKPLVELAEKNNSYLAVENHGQALLDSIDSLKSFVDLNTSARLGIALAPYHLQALNAFVPDAIRICAKQLFFFYAWQHYEDSKQLPGVGPTDMTPWIQALADIRYSRYVNPFMHGRLEPDVVAANLTKARNYLKACYSKVNPESGGVT